jgi:hypothetical protein
LHDETFLKKAAGGITLPHRHLTIAEEMICRLGTKLD